MSAASCARARACSASSPDTSSTLLIPLPLHRASKRRFRWFASLHPMISTIPLSIRSGLLTLPELTIDFDGRAVVVEDVFLDTGSGGTLLDADVVAEIGISFETGKDIRTIT